MKNLKSFLVLSVVVNCVFSCSDDKTSTDVVNNNGVIEKSGFDRNGNFTEVKNMDKDSFLLGERIAYHENGKIKKWYWYRNDKTNVPVYIIYFDSLGVFQDFKGNPFVSAGKTRKNSTVVELVNPPIVKSFSEYRDYYKGQLQRKIIYEPAKTDSTQWMTLDEHKYDSTHVYYVYFAIFDEKNTMLRRDSMQLVP